MEFDSDEAIVSVDELGFQCSLIDESAGLDVYYTSKVLTSEQRQATERLEEEFKACVIHSVELAKDIRSQLEFNMLIKERWPVDPSCY